MSRPLPRWLLVLAALLGMTLLLVLLVAVFLATHEQVEDSVPGRISGEARLNPLYALRQALRADGIQAHDLQALELDRFAGQPTATVLVHAPLGRLRRQDERRLLEWVERGGHLVVRVPRSRSPLDAVPPLLRQLGLEPELANRECVDLHLPGQSNHVEFCRGNRFTLAADAPPPRLAWPREGPHAFVRLGHGKGSVDVVADFDSINNRELRELPHQALVRQLLAPNYGRGPVYLVHSGSGLSRLQLLAARGWPLALPLCLLLAAWLWRRAQRFGPWLPAGGQERRSLLEHVRASGELLYRYGQVPLLHEAVRESFLARLRRRDPAAASLAGDARLQAIAARVGLPPETVRDALRTPEPRDRHGFVASVRTLIQMRNRL